MTIKSLVLLVILSTAALQGSKTGNSTQPKPEEVTSRKEENTKFFAFLIHEKKAKFSRCGGAIVDQDWIITSQLCLKNTFARRFCLRNFTNKSENCDWQQFESIRLDTVDIDERYNEEAEPNQNLAFGKMPRTVSKDRTIPICDDPFAGREAKLQSCGMNWLGSHIEKYFDKIQIINYKEVGNADPALIHVLRDDGNSSVGPERCVRNTGDPLYIVDANTSKPLCLYGVSTGIEFCTRRQLQTFVRLARHRNQHLEKPSNESPSESYVRLHKATRTCGGAFIAPDWILTTSPCLWDELEVVIEIGDFTGPAAMRRIINESQIISKEVLDADFGLINLSVKYKNRMVKLCDEVESSRLVAVGLFQSQNDNNKQFSDDVQFEQSELFELKPLESKSNSSVIHAFSFDKCLQQEGEPLYIVNEKNHNAECLYGLYRSCLPGAYNDEVKAFVFDNHFSRISVKKEMLENRTYDEETSI